MSILTALCVIIATIGFFIVRLFKRLFGKDTPQNNLGSRPNVHNSEYGNEEYDDYDDSSEYCFYNLSDEEQFCVNCDLAEQCRGWSIHDDKDDDDNNILGYNLFKDIGNHHDD